MSPSTIQDLNEPQRPVPEATVVIVSWNGRHHLDACLQSVLAQQEVAVEIVLVDNASSDGTADWVRAAFPQVRLVSLPVNAGFAGGSNAGARIARGRTLVMLNNDTIADPGWLRALLDGLDPAAGIGLTTSRVVYMHDPQIIDSAGDAVVRSGGAFKRHHGERAEAASRSMEVFGVCGAACAIPRLLFEELGGFDEDFFFSHEDVDLSYRARLRGYRCRYVAEARIRHHSGGTSGKASAFAVFHGQRNLEWVFVKNTPTSLLFRTLPGHVLYNIAAAVHFARIGRFRAFVRAKIAALAGLPRMLRRRADIQAARRVEWTDIARVMERRWLMTKLREKRFDVGLTKDHR